MTKRTDYIPQNNAEFERWFSNLVTYVKKMTKTPGEEWTHIPECDVVKLDDEYKSWKPLYEACLELPTKVDIFARNSARKKAATVIRPFVNRFLRHLPVTDEQRLRMEINVRKARSVIAVPTDQPSASIRFPGTHLVELFKFQNISAAGSDPRSNYGVRIHYGIVGANDPKYRIDEIPTSGRRFAESVFTRKMRYCFDFDGEAGKIVCFCLCYENAKGESGPFGPIIRAAIPGE